MKLLKGYSAGSILFLALTAAVVVGLLILLPGMLN